MQSERKTAHPLEQSATESHSYSNIRCDDVAVCGHHASCGFELVVCVRNDQVYWYGSAARPQEQMKNAQRSPSVYFFAITCFGIQCLFTQKRRFTRDCDRFGSPVQQSIKIRADPKLSHINHHSERSA
ncbi:hypothetical protein X801_01862 [Opisthorchis viverrini]|uniref:Uncharacterized protein n=1 Tax=Opisthorchis viverrini TaxID=6198 RepID=A0A1S8X668_OPIVI|nr:hypothetical protein X801_01862 [Opisthorchis viverrini]